LENRHKTRLIIYDRYKIVINSTKAHLGIQKSHVEVEHTNIFIFIYKNHLGRFITNTKQFILKDVHSNLLQFVVHKLDMT
jgi:hypothetical protein